MTTRSTYRLTADELDALNALWPLPRFVTDSGRTWEFWRWVAAARGLDYTTIIGKPFVRDTFTALPLGHGKHWCWPSPLNLQKPPPEFSAAEQHGVGVPA